MTTRRDLWTEDEDMTGGIFDEGNVTVTRLNRKQRRKP